MRRFALVPLISLAFFLIFCVTFSEAALPAGIDGHQRFSLSQRINP
jgi:hypothetical protein